MENHNPEPLVHVEFSKATVNFWKGIFAIIFAMAGQAIGVTWYLRGLVNQIENNSLAISQNQEFTAESIKILVVKVDDIGARLGRVEGRLEQIKK